MGPWDFPCSCLVIARCYEYEYMYRYSYSYPSIMIDTDTVLRYNLMGALVRNQARSAA